MTTAALGWFFGGGPHHRRPADINLLDAVVDTGAGFDGLAERIQVDYNEFESLDPELLEGRGVLGLAQVSQQPGMHSWVQCLDPAIEHLGKAGQLLHGGHRNPGVGNGLGR